MTTQTSTQATTQQIAIICAMEVELNSIIKILNLNTISIKNTKFTHYIAQYHNIELILLLCGIGKVNAAISTQYLLDTYSLKHIINVGVAGGLTNSLNFGDVVVATDLVYHDVDLSAFSIPKGKISSLDTLSFPCDTKLVNLTLNITKTQQLPYKVSSGIIASGDQFIDDKITATNIHTTFNAIACEMEGAAIAHTCYLAQQSCLIIRSLSDMAGSNDSSAMHSFNELKIMASDRASTIIEYLLTQLINT